MVIRMMIWPRRSASLTCGTAERTRMHRKSVQIAAGWCRHIADFAFTAAVRFRKACLSLEVFADGHYLHRATVHLLRKTGRLHRGLDDSKCRALWVSQNGN